MQAIILKGFLLTKELLIKELKRLPIGVDDFKKLITENYYYIDKTLFIKELLDLGSVATLIPRPRRFGKTLNMSMLKYFFEKPLFASQEKDENGLGKPLAQPSN